MFVIKRSLRSAVFQIQKVPSSTIQINIDIPFTSLLNDPDLYLANIPRGKPTFVVCRFGNDSQVAVGMMKSLKEQFSDVRDIKGGLDAWAETFPTDIIPKYWSTPMINVFHMIKIKTKRPPHLYCPRTLSYDAWRSIVDARSDSICTSSFIRPSLELQLYSLRELRIVYDTVCGSFGGEFLIEIWCVNCRVLHCVSNNTTWGNTTDGLNGGCILFAISFFQSMLAKNGCDLISWAPVFPNLFSGSLFSN